MLDLLRQLSAGQPSVAALTQTPVASNPVPEQAAEGEVSVPFLTQLDALLAGDRLAEAASETLALGEACELTAPVFEVLSQPVREPVSELAEQWLAGILAQQQQQVQVQAQPLQHYVAQEQVDGPNLPAPPVLREQLGVKTPAVNSAQAQASVPLAVSDKMQALPVVETLNPLMQAPEALPVDEAKPLAIETVATQRLSHTVASPQVRSDQAISAQLQQVVRQSLEVQVRQNIQQATIRLDPPELGSLEIFVSHEAGRLNVSIQATHADVSRLLGQTSDRLRQDLVAANYLQVNVQVGSDGQSNRDQRRPAYVPEQVLGAHVFDESAGSERAPTDVLVTV